MFSELKLLLILILFFFINPEIFSNTVNSVPACDLDLLGITCDSAICGDQLNDTILKIARFDYTENGSDFYYVRLSLFHSEFERLVFYEKARNRGIYIADKNDFYGDSALFITTFAKEQALLDFRGLFQRTINVSLSTSDAVKKEIVGSSPFYSVTASIQSGGLDVPLGGTHECSGANVACSANIYSFPAGTSGSAPPSVNGYPNYGCLNSTPCPAWYYMQVGIAGDIIIDISQSDNHDVDFICWGPFTSLTDGCATGLTGNCPKPGNPCCSNTTPGCIHPKGNITDCSYSPNATETCNILNAQVGEMYILLITNFSTLPGTITFSQTGGSGITNCNIVVFCSMIAITTNTTACNALTNTFSVSGNIEFSNPSPTGTLTITDNTAVPPVSQTFSPPFTSPLPYNLTNIPCDGAIHSLTAVFSDSLACNLTQQFTAPPASCPQAQISGGGTICDDGISQVTVNINISGSPGPYNFTYAINGIGQPPVTNYSGALPYQISTNIPGLYTLVSVSNLACPTGGPVSGSATVTLNPLPTPTITGPASTCLNIPVQYFTEDLMTGYVWTVSPGGTIQSGQGTKQVSVLWTLAGSWNISVNYINANGCTSMNPTPQAINVNTLPVPTITGDNPVCERVTKTYTTESGAQSYSWMLPPSGITVISGGGTTDNSVTIQWNTPGTYSIGVNYVIGIGCAAPQPTIVPVIVKPSPAPTFVQGIPELCQGTTGVVYSTQPGLSNYAWTVSAGGTVTSGGTVWSSSVTITWNAAGTQSVSVNYTNSNGCSALNPVIYNVTVNPLPVSTFTGNNTVCQLQPDPYLYPANNGPPCSYNWSITPPSGGSIANVTASPSSITWNTQGQATLGLTATTGFGCTSFSSQLITINPRPQVSITPFFDKATTKNARPIHLRGGLPLGMTGAVEYIGPGVQQPVAGTFIFDPANPMISGSGVGTPYDITYRYTNAYGCYNEVSRTIRVYNSNATNPCPGTVKDVRDNNRSYPTILVGTGPVSKCWMAENLDYGLMIQKSQPQTDNFAPEKYCLNDLQTACSFYGGMYQWDELVQYDGGTTYQDLCPPGWRLPLEVEWISLMNNYNGNSLAGSFLKDTLTMNGFAGLLQGVFYMNNQYAFFTGSNKGTFFWTANPVSPDRAIAHGINSFNPSVSYYHSSRANAFSVRCVRN